MFSSISGLQSDSVWLDVIGNNISNTNTVAYKASRVEFADQLSQNLTNGFGANSSNGMGGQNPQQVGLGTRVASIQTLFSEGSTLTTGISTDISIQGDGFLVAKSGDQTYLTRAGNLNFDSQGNLVDQNGGLIQGFNATLQYDQTPLVSAIPALPPFVIPPAGYNGNPPLFITTASMKLGSTNTNHLTNIQINRDMTTPPKPTTEVKFRGNLDSFQKANVLDLLPGGIPSLPIGTAMAIGIFFGGGLANTIDTTRMTVTPTAGGGFTLAQVSNLSTTPAGFNSPVPLENFFTNLTTIKQNAGNYAWEQQPPVPPADTVTETVYDSLGTPRQITVQFYQVNDLGSGGINNPNGPNQTCYAWYAFDTTGGQPVSTANLLGGTSIFQGDYLPYNRGNPALLFAGDFVWFNTDGSLAGSGGTDGFGGPPGPAFNFMDVPRVYLPPSNLPLPQGDVSPLPTQGAEIIPIDLNFGTFGLLGQGKRDGVTGDAEGNYQIVNGVNTYVPKQTVYATSQNGYSDGILQGLNFDQAGIIQGTFSNGQILSLAQLALAQPQNPEGLAKTGNNGYSLSPNTGPVPIGLPGQGNLGKIQGGSLEGSNVDLTNELSNMIIAQRGFDTNSRMISVVNETLNTLSHLGQ